MTTMHADDRPTERSALAAWYREALEEQEESGLSVAEYAEEIGVTAATLYQWRRRIAEDRAGPASAALGLVRVRVSRGTERRAEYAAARLREPGSLTTKLLISRRS